LTRIAAALKFNVLAKTVAKWFKRFRAEGVGELRNRSSRCHSLPSQSLSATSEPRGDGCRERSHAGTVAGYATMIAN
jgi:hypothetical protein